jgi:hypothetical protein
VLVILVQVFVWGWPFWTGKMFGNAKQPAYVKVPDSYAEVDTWLQGKGDGGRILHLPLTSTEAIAYKWVQGYAGAEPSQLLFSSMPSWSQGFNLQNIDELSKTVQLIAQISRKSVRELEGHLATLKMYSELQSTPITFEFATAVFSKFMDTQKRGLSVEDIQRIVAEKYSVSLKDLKSSTRVKTVVIPRQISMYLCRQYLDLGVADIGRAFGGRDHTTVLHALTKIKDLREIDEDIARDIKNLENKIHNSEWITP